MRTNESFADRMQTRDLSECTLAQYHVVPPGKKRKLAKKNASFRFSRVSYPAIFQTVFLVVGLLLAVLVVVQLACIAKWQVLRVCGRFPPESVVMVVQPAPVAVEEAVKPVGP